VFFWEFLFRFLQHFTTPHAGRSKTFGAEKSLKFSKLGENEDF